MATLINTNQIIIDEDAENLGKGGFGIVKRGLFEGQSVAVKSLLLNSTNTDPLSVAELFLTEAKNMRELKHERIVKFVGFIMETFSIVMEYMPDGTLLNHVAKHTDMPWSDRYQLARDVAEGMTYLHAKKTLDGTKKRPLFHQDLKSANILLCTENGLLRGKISDFGLSVIRSRTATPLSNCASIGTGGVLHVGGTGVYVAPELRQSVKFTKECDVYSYGVILLELSTSLDPVNAITDFRIHLKCYHIPMLFKQMIASCLSLDPTQRPSFDFMTSQLACSESENKSWELLPPLKNGNVSLMAEASQEFDDDSCWEPIKIADPKSYCEIKIEKLEYKQLTKAVDSGGDKCFVLTTKKRMLYIAIFIGFLVMMTIGLGVGLHFRYLRN